MATKKAIEQLITEASDMPMQDVTPQVQAETIPADAPVQEEPEKKKRGFTFDEVLSDSQPVSDLGGSQVSPTPQNAPKTPPKASGVAGFKAIGRVFEKVLEEVCQYKHGVDLETIGAKVNDKDLNMASELYGEGAERGELPKIPNWITLIAFVGLIFAFPIYKVMTYEPVRPRRAVPSIASRDDLDAIANASDDAPYGINPRNGQPYKKAPYKNRGVPRKGGKKK